MIARSKNEFDMFQQMDQELISCQKPRLMSDQELPNWLVKEEDEVSHWDILIVFFPGAELYYV